MKRKKKKYIVLLFTAVIIFGFVAFIRQLSENDRQFEWWLSSGRQHEAMIRKASSENDTLVTIAAGPHYERGAVYCFFFGKHYRDIWTLPVQAEVFDIDSISGGLLVVKRGGNQQTLSLRLENSGGKNFVLRTIDKDQAKALPENMQYPALRFLFRDQASALNPYGALVVSPLAEAAHLFHTNPKVYYLPYDARLGEFLPDFAGSLVIFEEYPDESWIGTAALNYPERIVSTDKMLQEKNDSPLVLVDYKQFVRCRIFDLLVGDWDRHGGQWKWAGSRLGDTLVYSPVPRDRDMAFYKYNDGIMNSISLLASPKMQTFSENFNNIKGMIFNARHLDSAMLGNVPRHEFIDAANDISKCLTDSAIDACVHKFPPGVYEKIGKEIAESLRLRRNKLAEAAEKYYELLHEE